MASSAEEPVPCTCECHRDPRIKHIMACCQVCDRCGGKFAKGLDRHRESCTGSRA